MKKILKKLHKQALECSEAVTHLSVLKDVTDDDAEILAETIDLLNDVHEIIFDKIFNDSESEIVND
jgi:hypothetical protein